MSTDFPSWIRIGHYDREEYQRTRNLLQEHNLNTVCLEADCPNRYECFSNNTATFMILGDTCTRDCRYCGVNKGTPRALDKEEPTRIAEAVKKLGLDYAVVTCVTRDDLGDGGAAHFVETVKMIRKLNPRCRTELLISDLGGDWNALHKIIDSQPDVLNHNIEVTKELFAGLRPQGDYHRSLQLLKKAKELAPGMRTKSGFMVGLGEEEDQIIRTIEDLKETGCDIITIGQYLQPSTAAFETKRYYTPAEFERFKEFGENMGMKVVAGPLVRSSYRASEI